MWCGQYQCFQQEGTVPGKRKLRCKQNFNPLSEKWSVSPHSPEAMWLEIPPALFLLLQDPSQPPGFHCTELPAHSFPQARPSLRLWRRIKQEEEGCSIGRIAETPLIHPVNQSPWSQDLDLLIFKPAPQVMLLPVNSHKFKWKLKWNSQPSQQPSEFLSHQPDRKPLTPNPFPKTPPFSTK